MPFAVVGHCEWVTFAKVQRLPREGEILTVDDSWEEPAGGGAVAAAELARLAGSAHFFTALGEDLFGQLAREQLPKLGIALHAAAWPGQQSRAFTFLQETGERTINVMHRGARPEGKDPLPWNLLSGMSAAYFVKGDVEALRHARRAKVLVATARVLPVLALAGVQVDALVHSAVDEGERYEAGQLHPPPRCVVSTMGAACGRYSIFGGETGLFAPASLTGPLVDTYGAGDSFAAGLTFGLGEGLSLPEALKLAAKSGAAALSRRGAHDGIASTR